MAPRLLKPKSGKARAAAEARVRASARCIVVAGTYRVKQLAWIEKNGVYNYPVKDGDEFTPESFGKIGELWLYADAKATRHVFAAEFVGKATQAEFLAAHPTYAKQVGAHNHPSGDPTPSAQDRRMAAEVSALGERLGVEVLDSLVLGAAGN